jgi:uncharacterized protein
VAIIDLPDVNVWIAMSAPSHVHRVKAERYWRDEAAGQVAFNAVTMLGLVRICCNAPIFDGSTLTPEEAWNIFQGWMAQEGVTFLGDPAGCRTLLDRLVAAGTVSSRNWTDAYLASFALSGGIRLVSFDSDFQQFPGLSFLHLHP